MNIPAFITGLALASTPVGAANATEILFTISGGDPTTTFELPAMPVPDSFVSSFSFVFNSVPAIYGGSAITLRNLTFFSGSVQGGLMDELQYFNLTGAQLYTGPESSPTFAPSVFTGLLNGSNGNIDSVTLTAVPEASIWAMMLAGFASLGFAGYRSSRQTVSTNP
jgi:hypothetical protein